MVEFFLKLTFFGIAAGIFISKSNAQSPILNQRTSIPQKCWKTIDLALTGFKNRRVDIEISFPDTSNIGTARLPNRNLTYFVGPNLHESRLHSITPTLPDHEGKIREYCKELICRKDSVLVVSFTKTRGEPLPYPEKNVSVVKYFDPSMFKQIGIYPEFVFGLLDDGIQFLDLESENTRSSFEVTESNGYVELRRIVPNSEVSLRFTLADGEAILENVEILSRNLEDDRAESIEKKLFDFAWEGNRLRSFRNETRLKYKPSFLSAEQSAQLTDGIQTSVSLVTFGSQSEWQKESEPLRFVSIPVPNGFPARVDGQLGVKYEYHDGDLVLVVNQTAQDLIEAMKEVASPIRILDGAFWKKELDKFLATSNGNRRQEPDEVAGYCGLYSIAAAAAVHGKSIEFSKLLSSNYIQSTLGSTAEELQQAIADNDLFSQLVFHASPIYLKNSQSPVLLHLGNNYSSGAPQHWVLYLGQDDAGNAVILDTPQSIESLPFAALQTHWDGTAIAISDQPVSRVAQVKTWLGGIFPLALSVLLLTTASLFAQRSAANSVTTALLLAGVIFVGCVIWSVYDPSAFWKNATPVALTESKVRRELEIDEINDVDQLRKEGVLLVDARTPRDFSMGSLPGAVNLPLNPTLGTLISVVGQAKKADRVIVYCQSEDCKWSDTVGGKLKTMGIEKVSVFRPGWRGFVEKMQAGRSPSGVKE